MLYTIRVGDIIVDQSIDRSIERIRWRHHRRSIDRSIEFGGFKALKKDRFLEQQEEYTPHPQLD